MSEQSRPPHSPRMAPRPATLAPAPQTTTTAPQPSMPPDPPITPKPSPPPFAPTRFPRYRPPIRVLRVRSVIDFLPAYFHPTLRPVEGSTEERRAESIATRTGLVNPPLPTQQAIWHRLAPRRRLYVPLPMVFGWKSRRLPCCYGPAREMKYRRKPPVSVSPQSRNRSGGNPELDPEC